MGAAPTQLPPGAQPQQGGTFQPGGPGPSQGSMAGTYPGQAPSHTPNVGYQAPAGAPQGQAPGGWQQPQVNPQQSAPHAGNVAPGQQHGAPMASPNAPTAGYPSSGPTPQPGGPASGPAAQANALPAGAHYTQAQPASPTAYPSNPVHGFAHGNPTPNS
jgi:hypothetical protein